MPTVNQVRDAELARQKRNHTEAQKKNLDATKEGVVVNTFIKAPNMDDVYNSMVISQNAKMPEKLYENNVSKEKSILPISLVTTGVMASIALLSAMVRHSAKVNLTLSETQKIDFLQRNIAINKETDQAIFQMITCTNQKTILAGTGVLALSAMGFMGKMFIDGFKEIWVRKKEADIQKNLQENLIAVETQSFSGKIQIIRSMLSDKAKEFNEYLCPNPKTPIVFAQFNKSLNFKGEAQKQKEISKENNLKYFALGALTLGSIVGLAFLTLNNLTRGKVYLEKTIVDKKSKVAEIVKKSAKAATDAEKENIKTLLQSIDADENYIKTALSKLNWRNKSEKEEFIKQTCFNVKRSSAKADKAVAGDGIPKPSFYSHVDDYRAFFYNYLLDSANPVFKNLFLGITGATAASYIGSVFGQGIKEVQVKKYNAQTELELQQKLVSTELRNFKAKKDAAIEPLCEEFYTQVQKGKSKEELKVMAENILFEVKNGPPFVYS